MLLEELLDEVFLSVLITWSVFVRIVSIVFYSRCFSIGGIINGTVLGSIRRSILQKRVLIGHQRTVAHALCIDVLGHVQRIQLVWGGLSLLVARLIQLMKKFAKNTTVYLIVL